MQVCSFFALAAEPNRGIRRVVPRVFGNYFGTALQSSTGTPNTGGNVGVGDTPETAVVAAGFTPVFRGTAVVGLDANGNQHTRSLAGIRPIVRQPWRR